MSKFKVVNNDFDELFVHIFAFLIAFIIPVSIYSSFVAVIAFWTQRNLDFLLHLFKPETLQHISYWLSFVITFITAFFSLLFNIIMEILRYFI